MAKWLWQLKWFFVIAIFAGPVLAYFQYQDSQRIQRIMANGAAIEAHVDELQVQRSRRSDSYSLTLSFVSPHGTSMRQHVDVTGAFARSITVGDAINIQTTRIRYLPSESSEPIVIVADADNMLRADQEMMWTCIIAAILGLIISPIWFVVERRMQKKQDDDIDAELARMRSGQAPLGR